MSYKPQFIAPQGRGRPIQDVDLPTKIENFVYGVDTFFDSMTANKGSHFALNTDCFQGRTLDKRAGSSLVGADGGAGKVLMMGSLEQMGGDDILLRIITTATDVQMQKYSTSGGWVNLGSAFGSTSSHIDFFGISTVIGGEERFYFTNGVDILRYTDGSTISTVSDGADDIYGKYIAVVENILILGNLGTPFSSNQLVWSKAGTHQFRRDVDTDYASSSNLITLDCEITRVVTLGWLVYIFTASNGLWELDLSTGIPRVVSTHGTLSPKSVAVGHNTMIWADQYNIWGIVLGGSIQKLGDSVVGVYPEIDYDNFLNMNATIARDGKYILWVGDLSYEGNSYTDVALVYDIEKSRETSEQIWRVWSNIKSNCWCEWTNESHFTRTYFGSYEEENTYTIDSGTDDSGTDIKLIWQSKDFPIVDEKKLLTVKDIYVKVKPDNTNDIVLSVYVRTDMGAWVDLGDMTIDADNTVDMKIYRIQSKPGVTGRTLAVKFEVDNSYDFKLYELFITTNQVTDEVRPTSA